MTISSTTRRWSYTGDGSTTVFAYNNKIFADSELEVYVDAVLKTLTTDYTVSGAGDEAGGSATFTAAPASGTSVVIIRNVPIDQETDLPAGGAFPASAVEDVADKLTIIDQQQEETLSRAPKYAKGTTTDVTLAAPVAGRALRYNGDASEIEPVSVGELSDSDTTLLFAGNLLLNKDAVADMKADSTLQAGMRVLTLEHTTGYGYEGGNLYVARAVTGGTDDNGSLIKSTGNTAIEFVGLFPNGVNAEQFGAAGDWNGSTGTDDSTAIQNAITYSKRLGFTDGKKYLMGTGVTKSADDVEVDFGTAEIINNGPTHCFVFGATSDTPTYSGLRVRGGVFSQADAATTEDRNYIRVAGTKNFSVNRFIANNVSNGGIYVEAGCEDGEIIGRIAGKSANATCRGVWLNGSTASDYAGQLVDTTSITRNATALPVYAVKDVRVLIDATIPAYGLYAINTRNCEANHCTIDISGAGANRCIAINNYSPGFSVNGGTFTSDRSSTGILVTQFSTGVIIDGARFKGDFGGNRDIYVQYLAEASITNCKFLTDSTQQIEVDMGGEVDVRGNYSNSPSGYQADHKFVTVTNLDNSIAGTGTVGDTATMLAGSVIEGNTVKQARIPVLLQALASASGNISGIDTVVTKNNTFKDFDLVTTSSEYGMLVIGSGSTNLLHYTYYDNDMLPADNANRNRVETSGSGNQAVRTDHQSAVFEIDNATGGGAVTVTKKYGGNFSCSTTRSSNDLHLSPRTINGASGAGVALVESVTSVDGTTYSYDLHKSGNTFILRLFDSAGTKIALSTTAATVQVVLSFNAT